MAMAHIVQAQPASDNGRPEAITPEQRLTQAARALRSRDDHRIDLLSAVAHEIRNPLNAMLGFSQLMKDEKFGPLGNDRYREYAEILHLSAERLLRVCNHLLVDPADESVAPPPPPVAAKVLLDHAVALYGEMAASRGVRLASKVDPGFPMLLVDPDLIEGALGDLVTNAIKFTPSGGRVTLHASVCKDSRAAIMVITDSGVGINQETLNTLIAEGKVAPATGPHGDRGSGVGLGILLDRLRALGVQLEFKSGPEIGTAVRIRFPKRMTVPDDVPKASGSGPSQKIRPPRNFRI